MGKIGCIIHKIAIYHFGSIILWCYNHLKIEIKPKFHHFIAYQNDKNPLYFPFKFALKIGWIDAKMAEIQKKWIPWIISNCYNHPKIENNLKFYHFVDDENDKNPLYFPFKFPLKNEWKLHFFQKFFQICINADIVLFEYID